MRWRASLAALALALTAGARAAPPAPPPGAVETYRAERGRDGFALPVRPFGGDAPVNARVEGALTLQALRIGDGVTSLGVALAYRERLTAEGFSTVLFCAAPDCGGFDFRAALSVLPQPAMRLDLTDFTQLTMRRDTAEGTDWVAVLASGADGATHAQVATVEGARPAALVAAPGDALRETAAVESAPPPADDPGATLDRDGHVALDGVIFQTGAAEIAGGAEDVLARAASALAARADRDFVVVGHTDASGALDLNRRISAQRAETVRAALIALGAPPERLSAEGAGWLAPRAPNATEEGRARNRRVEIIAR